MYGGGARPVHNCTTRTLRPGFRYLSANIEPEASYNDNNANQIIRDASHAAGSHPSHRSTAPSPVAGRQRVQNVPKDAITPARWSTSVGLPSCATMSDAAMMLSAQARTSVESLDSCSPDLGLVAGNSIHRIPVERTTKERPSGREPYCARVRGWWKHRADLRRLRPCTSWKLHSDRPSDAQKASIRRPAAMTFPLIHGGIKGRRRADRPWRVLTAAW